MEAPKQESTALATLDDNVNTGLIAALQEDYQAINESPSDYVQSLVVRTFCPLPSTTQSKIDVPTEVANYNSYLQFYKDSKDAFIKVVKPLVEKLLGVKMFFDQYKCKTKGMIPTLLVANLKPEMLAKSSSLPTCTPTSTRSTARTTSRIRFGTLSSPTSPSASRRGPSCAGNGLPAMSTRSTRM